MEYSYLKPNFMETDKITSMMQKRMLELYVLNCIMMPGRDEEMTGDWDSNDAEFHEAEARLKYFMGQFVADYDTEENRERWPNDIDRMEQYLRSLPSCFDIDYDTSCIIEVGYDVGMCSDEQDEDKFVEQWWHLIAKTVLGLCWRVGEVVVPAYACDYRPKLKLVPKAKFVKEDGGVVLRGASSPGLAAKEFVEKVFGSGHGVTGLFMLDDDKHRVLQTWEDADINPVDVPVIIAVVDFRYKVMFADFGYKAIPMILDLDNGGPKFSPIYRAFKWIKDTVPTDAELLEVLQSIDLQALRDSYSRLAAEVEAEKAKV